MENRLVEFAVVLPVALVLAYLIARALRALFRGRVRLSLPAMVIVSVLGLSVGILLADWWGLGDRVFAVWTLLLAFGSSLVISLLVAGAAALIRPDDDVDVPALLAAGESDRVEFKETARWNVREDKKDARMEQVVAKTVAAFLNTGGGVLIIGANDAGEPVGLDRDLATLRTPDHDRFELWLRDLLSTTLGRNAAALPGIRFAAPDGGAAVCAVVVPRSSKPVFLTHAGSTDLWVRVGNSTRALGVDDAVEYVARHWRPTVRTFLIGPSS
ncbi:helix-turn-helix domain-containing protein [Microbacterium sp.]|uniref:AlbA family DNA-binding domain-containing protein n=1 Tax=Microbacterium sp. TaxID=51671 RepID=UPI003A83DD30